MAQFNKVNTNFFGPTKTGELAVFMHYPQGANVITMMMATATKIGDGAWERNNHADGPSRWPRRYISDFAALAKMVAPKYREKEFETDQDAVIAAHDAYHLKKEGAQRAGYEFQMKTRNAPRAELGGGVGDYRLMIRSKRRGSRLSFSPGFVWAGLNPNGASLPA